jgi:hypothetical protein
MALLLKLTFQIVFSERFPQTKRYSLYSRAKPGRSELASVIGNKTKIYSSRNDNHVLKKLQKKDANRKILLLATVLCFTHLSISRDLLRQQAR